MTQLSWSILNLNPCIDKNCYLDTEFKCGTLNRISKAIFNYAGKGLNQAIIAARLGQLVTFFSFKGEDRSLAEEITHKEGISLCEAETSAGVRTNIKIIDSVGQGTELNERGGPYSSDEKDALLKAFMSKKAQIFSMAGSIPEGIEQDIYAQLIGRIKQTYPDAVIVLDSDGIALKEGIKAGPSLIKPNLRELAGLIGTSEEDLSDDETLKKACMELSGQYHTSVICTLDERGAIYAGKEGLFRAGIAKVKPKGFSGAGDTFLAAFLTARVSECLNVAEALEFASRAAGAKVALEGTLLPSKEEIEQLPKVRAGLWE